MALCGRMLKHGPISLDESVSCICKGSIYHEQDYYVAHVIRLLSSTSGETAANCEQPRIILPQLDDLLL